MVLTWYSMGITVKFGINTALVVLEMGNFTWLRLVKLSHFQYNTRPNFTATHAITYTNFADHNQDTGRLRNIRAGGYSYSEAKRSHDLPLNMDISSASKHKSLGMAAMIRPSDNGLLPPVNHKSECYPKHYSSQSLMQ